MEKGKRKARDRHRWLCLDCGRHTGRMKEHYFVKNEVWFSVMDSETEMLCVGCLEGRLKRKLTAADFTDAWINDPKRNSMSDRLRERLGSELSSGSTEVGSTSRKPRTKS